MQFERGIYFYTWVAWVWKDSSKFLTFPSPRLNREFDWTEREECFSFLFLLKNKFPMEILLIIVYISLFILDKHYSTWYPLEIFNPAQLEKQLNVKFLWNKIFPRFIIVTQENFDNSASPR